MSEVGGWLVGIFIREGGGGGAAVYLFFSRSLTGKGR